MQLRRTSHCKPFCSIAHFIEPFRSDIETHGTLWEDRFLRRPSTISSPGAKVGDEACASPIPSHAPDPSLNHDPSEAHHKIPLATSWSDIHLSGPSELRRNVESIISQPQTTPWATVGTINSGLHQIVMDALQSVCALLLIRGSDMYLLQALDQCPKIEDSSRRAAIKSLQAISRVSGGLPSNMALHNVQLQNTTVIAMGGFSVCHC